MKLQSKFFTAYKLKTLFILICITVSFAGFTNCKAQAIVGKWKEVFLTSYITPELVKSSHGHLQAIQDIPLTGEIIQEFYANKTFKVTITATATGTKKIETGTWSLSGDQLTTTLDANQPDPKDNPKKKGDASGNLIIQISGNSLIMTWVKPNPRVNKMEYTYKKM